MITDFEPVVKDTSRSCVFDFPDRPVRPTPPTDGDGNPIPTYPYEPILDWPTDPLPQPGTDPNPPPVGPPTPPIESSLWKIWTIQPYQFHRFDDSTSLFYVDGAPAGLDLAVGGDIPSSGHTNLTIPFSSKLVPETLMPAPSGYPVLGSSGLLLCFGSEYDFFSPENITNLKPWWVYPLYYTIWMSDIDGTDTIGFLHNVQSISGGTPEAVGITPDFFYHSDYAFNSFYPQLDGDFVFHDTALIYLATGFVGLPLVQIT